MATRKTLTCGVSHILVRFLVGQLPANDEGKEMAYEKKVLIEWKDNIGEHLLTTVSIDEAWNSLDEDDTNIFFYFSKESEYRDAFTGEGLEFRIVKEVE